MKKAVMPSSHWPLPPHLGPATGIHVGRRARHWATWAMRDPSANTLSPCKAPTTDAKKQMTRTAGGEMDASSLFKETARCVDTLFHVISGSHESFEILILLSS